MGVETVVAIVVAAVSVAGTVMQAQEAKKNAKRQAAIRRRAVENEAAQRKLREDSQRAALAREARAKRAAILNTSGQDGALFTSSFRGAYGAVGQNEARELNLLNRSSELAAVSDEITREQIAADASAARRSANAAVVGSALKGLGQIGGAVLQNEIDFSSSVPSYGTQNQSTAQYVANYPANAI